MKKIIFIFISVLILQPVFSQKLLTVGLRGDQFGTFFKYNAGDTAISEVSMLEGLFGSMPDYTKFAAKNGKLYGTTSRGGKYWKGVIFEFNPSTGTYIKKVDIPELYGKPTGELFTASNGKIYGYVYDSNVNTCGSIFEYDATVNLISIVHNFNGIQGCHPTGSFVEISNGILYGQTTIGCSLGYGGIFEYNLNSGVITNKHEFDQTNGNSGRGTITLASNGLLYGVTYSGGAFGGGVLYEYDPVNNVYSKKVDFSSGTGYHPTCTLSEGANGKLYGYANYGGLNFSGGIFEYDFTTHIFTHKKDFYTYDGYFATGKMLLASNNKFYFTTADGGGTFLNVGNVFEYDYINNSLNSIFDFNYLTGHTPLGSLYQTNNGKIYGTASEGGISSSGSIFEFNINTSQTIKKVDIGSSNGERPNGPPTAASNGKFYGTTSLGGAFGGGVIYEYNYYSNTYLKKHDFSQSAYGELSHVGSGKFLGITRFGELYEYDYLSDQYSPKLNLGLSEPVGHLTESSNGKYYGMTTNGGMYGEGAIFEYDFIANTAQVMHNFNPPSGIKAVGSLCLASNGKFYGMTTDGGANNQGVLFKFSQNTNQYIKLVDFSDSLGSEPYGSLIKASNGFLYGMTRRGGAFDDGVIFKFNTQTKVITKIFDFNSASGINPLGSLFEASNGLLYGTTAGYGSYFGGTVFEFDPATEIFTKKVDLIANVTGGGFYSFIEVFCAAPGITPQGPVSFCVGDSVILNSSAAAGSTFQWYINNNMIAGAINASYTATLEGDYTVVAEDPACNSIFTSNIIKVRIPCIPVTGNSEKLQTNNTTASMVLYENEGSLNINCKNLPGNKYSVSIIDITGKIVKKMSGSFQDFTLETQMDVELLSSGIYCLMLSTNSEQLTSRFFKK